MNSVMLNIALKAKQKIDILSIVLAKLKADSRVKVNRNYPNYEKSKRLVEIISNYPAEPRGNHASRRADEASERSRPFREKINALEAQKDFEKEERRLNILKRHEANRARSIERKRIAKLLKANALAHSV